MGTPTAHAVLSPSGASRWLNCTPSARLELQFPDSAGKAAAEGTLAHSLGEYLLREKLGQLSHYEDPAAFLAVIEADPMYSPSMRGYCEDYAVFVMERFAEAQQRTADAQIYIETRLDLRKYVPEGFGTGDSIIIADGILDITDYKHGKGVPVFSENNKQMMLYALGALEAFDMMFDIQTVRMTIFQPRIDNTSDWEIPVTELRNWAAVELKPKADLAFKGEGEYMVGQHCQFCRARGLCKAFADHNLEIAKHEFRNTNLLTDEDISDILGRAPLFSTWLKGVLEYALTQAVSNDKHWPGFKLVEGRSNRVFTNIEEVAAQLKTVLPEDEIYKPRDIFGITELEKKIGKKAFAELVGQYLLKPSGKPTLAPESDKRPAYSTADKAALDFMDEDDN